MVWTVKKRDPSTPLGIERREEWTEPRSCSLPEEIRDRLTALMAAIDEQRTVSEYDMWWSVSAFEVEELADCRIYRVTLRWVGSA